MIAHAQAAQHSAPALRRPFDGLRDWLLPAQPAASPLRHRSPLTCLNNVYTSCHSPKLLRARPSPSSDSATQTSPPTHRDNVYASAYAPKPPPSKSMAPAPANQPAISQFFAPVRVQDGPLPPPAGTAAAPAPAPAPAAPLP